MPNSRGASAWTTFNARSKKQVKKQPLEIFNAAHDDTNDLTAQIAKIEQAIDERVAGLYGL
jgi:hypothetical protein